MHALVLTLLLQSAAPPAEICTDSIAECTAYELHLQRVATLSPDSIWRDLRYIGTPAEAAEWFSLASAAERRDFVMKFWARRAAMNAISAPTRYAEHVRRLEHARRWYGRDYRFRLIGAFGATEWYAAAEKALRPEGRARAEYPIDMDDRGLIYMRFGEPDKIERCSTPRGQRAPTARTRSGNSQSFESGEIWVYESFLAGAPRLHFFGTRGRAGDYQIVLTPAQTLCQEDQVRHLHRMLAAYEKRLHLANTRDSYSERGTGTDLGSAVGRAFYDPQPIARFSAEAALLQDNLEDAMNGLAQEQLGEIHEGLLESVHQLLVFRSLGDTTAVTVVASTAARLRDMTSARDARRSAFRMRLGVSDGASLSILPVDSTTEFPTPAASSDALVEFHDDFDLLPGSYDYTMRTAGGDAALGVRLPFDADDPTARPRLAGPGGVWRGSMEIPSIAGNLSISSLAIGYPADAPGAWHRLGHRMSLIPTHVLPPDARVGMYYEVYGVAPDSPVHTEITILPRGSDKIESVVAFDEQAAYSTGTTIITAFRTIDFSGLKPGLYDVIVSVRTGDRDIARATIIDLTAHSR